MTSRAIASSAIPDRAAPTSLLPYDGIVWLSAPGKSDGFSSVPIGKDGTCIVNAAASVNGGARVVIGCVDAVPVLLNADPPEDDAVRNAVRGANLDPPSDVHASADYRRHLAEVVAVRAVAQANGKR